MAKFYTSRSDVGQPKYERVAYESPLQYGGDGCFHHKLEVSSCLEMETTLVTTLK